MEELLKGAVTQVPALTVVAVLAYYGLKAQMKFIEGRDVFIKEMHDEHIQARKESREAIEKNTEAADRNTVALSKVQMVMEMTSRSAGNQ